jgi:hypothetical protein
MFQMKPRSPLRVATERRHSLRVATERRHSLRVATKWEFKFLANHRKIELNNAGTDSTIPTEPLKKLFSEFLLEVA